MSDYWHQHNLRVQYKDTDQMGVVHHGNYITWFEVARIEWMRNSGMNYRHMEELGLLLPVLDVNVSYIKSAKFDDCVALFTKVASFSPVRLEFYYEARKINEEEFHKKGEGIKEPFGDLLAKGTTKHMWVNQDFKPARLHKVAPEILQMLEKTARVPH